MLAYVFAHRAAADADVGAYEDALRSFHAALAAGRPDGFISSLTYRIGDGYSDWYLIRDSAVLDALNEAAVTGGRTTAHDAAARMAVDGAGKLLALTSGESNSDAACETRFAKPKGVSYRDLYARLETWTSQPGFSLWRRMMVLGPAPEFCLVSPEPIELPADMSPELVARMSI